MDILIARKLNGSATVPTLATMGPETTPTVTSPVYSTVQGLEAPDQPSSPSPTDQSEFSLHIPSLAVGASFIVLVLLTFLFCE